MSISNEQNAVLDELEQELLRVNELVEKEKAYRATDEAAKINDLVAYAISYAGRAVTQVERNRRDGYDTRSIRRAMLIKAAGLLINAAVVADTEDDLLDSLPGE